VKVKPEKTVPKEESSKPGGNGQKKSMLTRSLAAEPTEEAENE